eukprot:GHVR01188893.1.p1 GENE.GHVR01188893.1~~GHVR01188893.1.p1  ORF type:complete len:109 (-),score=13.45 GHVR01188893.1:35-361(-)
MKWVHTLYDPLLAGHIEAVLKDAGIECLVKNKHLMGGVGDIPALETWPEIWVLDERDENAAKALIEALARPVSADAKPWRCPTCGEHIDAQFTECWACAAPPPDTLEA